MNPIRLILVDHDALLREYLALDFGRRREFEVVAQCADAAAAVVEAQRLRPDVVLFDVDLPGLMPFDAARTIRRSCPETRVLYLGAYAHDDFVRRALASGASGYLTRSSSRETLAQAICAVAAGDRFFSDDVKARLVSAGEGGQPGGTVLRTRASTLTDREWEVLRYLAQGSTFKSVAVTMSISEGTVRKHTANLMKKLDLHKRADLTRFAIRENIVEPWQ